MSQDNSSPGIVGYVGANQVAIGSTVSPFVINGVAPGVSGTVLASNGVSSNPSFQSLGSVGGLTSVTGTANEITASTSSGAVTLSTPSTFIAPGSIASTTSLTAGNGFTVTTGTSNIDGTALFKGPTPWADVVAYGADPTGVASSVAAFNAAIASIPVGGIVWIPVGTYKIDSAVTVSTPHIRFCGASRTDSILNNTGTTTNTINLNTFYGGCENLTFTAPSNTQTAGFAIGMSPSSDYSYVWRCDFTNMYQGIQLIGNLSYADDIGMRTFSNAAAGGGGIVINGTNNAWINKLTTNNGTTLTGFAAIRLIQVSAILVSNCQLIGATTAMSIEPTVGLTVPSVEVINTFFDTSSTGLSVTGAGTPARCKFTNCWFSSQTIAGITFNNANMSGFTFVNCDFYGNAIGINALAATDWQVSNSRFAGNTTAGIQTTAAATHSFQILDSTIGPTAVFGANAIGINIQSGTYASYRIKGNIGLAANTTAGITDSGVVANQNQKEVADNLGATIKGGISATTAASGAINTAETIVAGGLNINGSTAVIPANSLQIGTTIRILVHGTCTSTAANVSTFTLRMGTAGTTGDASVATAATSIAATSGTTVGFTGIMDFTVRTIGSTGTIAGSMLILNTGIIGISANNTQSIPLTATATLNTTTANYISLTYKSAATTTTSTFQNGIVEIVKC
jgi:trimeric autotransporter adhesin